MISGPPGIGGHCFKTQCTKIEAIDKHIDHPDRVVFLDIFI
jgi:hypothetical protein